MSQNAIEIGETGNAEDRMLNGCSTAQRMHLVPWTLDMVLRNLEMSMGKGLNVKSLKWWQPFAKSESLIRGKRWVGKKAEHATKA